MKVHGIQVDLQTGRITKAACKIDQQSAKETLIQKARMSPRDLPSYAQLEAAVTRSFVHPARFIPARVKFWTCPTDDMCVSVTQKRARCRAHKTVKLAVPVIAVEQPVPVASPPNLQLLCGYTDCHTSPIIVIGQDTWAENGMFEVCCFDPDFEVDADSGEKKIIYRRGTGMEFIVKWDKMFRWKRFGMYRQLDTTLPLSLFEEAADLFMDLLNFEFGH